MEEEVKKLREAGFSDEDIRAYMEEQKSSTNKNAPGIAPVSPEQAAAEPTRVNETVPDYGGTTPTSALETAGTVAAAVAPYAVPAALTAGGLYGGSVLKSGFDAMKASAAARTAQANAQMAATQGLQQRFEARQAAQQAGPGMRTAPTPRYNVPVAQTPNMPPAAMTAPPAPPPVGGPAAQQGADFISRITKQFAPMAAKVAPVLSGLNRALPAAQVGMGLFYTSPEEMEILRAAEARRRQQGQ